jgi:hypothetical protein
MHIGSKDDSYVLSLAPKERLCLSGVLNEVLHGFRVPKFDQQIGLSRREADDLHVRLMEKSSPESSLLELTIRQLLGLRNALIETVKELGVEEFSTRVGVSLQDAEQLVLQIDRATRSVGDPPVTNE